MSVQVDEHEALPDGCSMRFRATGEPFDVRHVFYDETRWAVAGEDADGNPLPAVGQPVDDSSAGTSILVVGGAHGLRLRSEAGEVVAEAYLLLAPSAVVA